LVGVNRRWFTVIDEMVTLLSQSLFRKLLLVDSQIAATRVVAGDML